MSKMDKCIADIQSAIQKTRGLAEKGCDEQTYMNARSELNVYLISALTGCTISTNRKGELKLKHDMCLPSKYELSTIVNMVNVFRSEVEIPYFDSLHLDIDDDNDDDMEIPAGINMEEINIPLTKDMGVKDFQKMLTGTGQASIISDALLTATDCCNIAAIGESLRHKKNRDRVLITMGILAAVGIATGVGVYMYNKHKDSDDEMDEDLDLAEIAEDNDDMPSVELDEEFCFCNIW